MATDGLMTVLSDALAVGALQEPQIPGQQKSLDFAIGIESDVLSSRKRHCFNSTEEIDNLIRSLRAEICNGKEEERSGKSTRRISFGAVHVREHGRELLDHQGTPVEPIINEERSTLPHIHDSNSIVLVPPSQQRRLSLSWDIIHEEKHDFEEFEKDREKQRRGSKNFVRDCRLSFGDRERLAKDYT